MKISKKILPLIVISQFCCTSLWFASNGVMSDLVTNFQLQENTVSSLTSAVQFGFIIGTLLFALFSFVDRFSPSKVFFISAMLGALFNLGLIIEHQNLYSLLILRFLTGFFLAGIYPVGMKIATDYFEKGLGKSLGFLVGALVLGTALPHLLKDILQNTSWTSVLITTSFLSVFGGLIILLFVPNGPFRKSNLKINLKAMFLVFQNKPFQKAAFGYFGHMWELYTFWAFIPLLLSLYIDNHKGVSLNIPLLSFSIISIGSLACVFSGIISEKFGVKKIATTALFLSGLCCLLFPFFLLHASTNIFIIFLFLWGMFVIADSPLFSTLVANAAPKKEKGTALTIVNCIGFSITIVSIQSINLLLNYIKPEFVFIVLAIGPLFGLIALYSIRLKIN